MAQIKTRGDSMRTMSLEDQEKLQFARHSEDHRHQHNASPSQKTKMPRWSGKRKEKTVIARACGWLVNHQIGLAVYLLSLLLLTHLSFPAARHHTQKFFRISYFNPRTGTYALGWDDIFFVFYWIIVFTGMRCAAMDYVLTPIAAWAGIHQKKARLRFAEQAWILLYYTCFWLTGMYIFYSSDYWLNLRALWSGWPVREMDGFVKWYYLVQFAFWLQQIVVVNIEERRKDHWQMFSHHIITCALIFTSYGYHQSKVGNVILCLMDVVDLIFPLAKILKYLNMQTACDIAFGVFMVTYFITRHVLYMRVVWSIYRDIPREIKLGCYSGSVEDLKGPFPVPNDYDHLIQPFRDPVGLVCWNDNISWAFILMLLGLQCILLIWFGMILRVAYKVIKGQPAEDSRSDEEDEEEKEEEDVITVDGDTQKLNTSTRSLLEKEAPNTADDNPSFPKSPPARRSSRRRNENGHSSGVNLRDRKDLLGRIGCDKTPPSN